MEAAIDGGVCNTHLRFISETPSVVEAGIDTWRIARYLDDEQDLRRAVRYLDGRTFQKVEGHAVGVMPAHRMLWIEGHPAVDGLAAPRTLGGAQERLLSALRDHGLPAGRDGGVSRLDQTVTLAFAEPAAGQAFLTGLSVADVPRVKPAIYGRPIETVYMLGRHSGRVMARAYDKGVESGQAARGSLVRLENQTRFQTRARMKAQVHAEHPDVAASLFEHRFAPVAESVHGLHAASGPVVAERLRQLVGEGALGYRQAERLMGFLMLGERPGLSRPTIWRRRRELREHGLVLVDPLEDPVEVDVSEGIEAALAAWSDA